MRFEKSEFNGLYQDYQEYKDKFFNWYCMSTKQFDDLLKIIERRIQKKKPTSESQCAPRSSFASH